jgi:hypothetical protein
MSLRHIFILALVLGFGFISVGFAAPVTITFDDLGLSHGAVITNQVPHVQIRADNFHRAFDLAILYDSDDVHPEDPDLEFGFGIGLPDWKGGNLSGVHLGNMLIISENDFGDNPDEVPEPDDEGRRLPDGAGELEFSFDKFINSVSFDLVDVEPESGEPGWVSLYSGATELATIDFLALSGHPDILSPVAFGDNFANRFAPLTTEELGIDPFNRVVFHLGGSGAVDTITYNEVPEPGTVALLGLGLVTLFGVTRRRRNRT